MENFLVESNIYFEATAAVFGLVLCVFLFLTGMRPDSNTGY